jgi:hypothetical protein
MNRSGEFKHRLEIQKNFPTVNSVRQKVDDWRAFCVRKARRPRAPRNAPVLVGDANRSEINTVTFFVRADSLTQQIDSNMQMISLGKTYKIEAAEFDQESNEVELTCRAR